MPAAPLATETLTVALIGNPNTGKSTLFNALSGFRAVTGNYPGVTVEKKIGRTRCGERDVNLVDLPGTYSLSPRTLDEMVAVDLLLGHMPDVGKPDVVVCILDASNAERNLYLVSQVLDLGLPTVLVLNMTDVAQSRGINIDAARLSQRLGLPVVQTEAHRKRGIDELRQAILQAAAAGPVLRPRVFPESIAAECEQLNTRLKEWGHEETPYYLLERLLLDIGGYLENHLLNRDSQALRDYLADARNRLSAQGCRIPAVEAQVRYRWARETLDGVLTRPAARPVTFSDKLDRVLTHRFSGLVVFVLLMFVVFQAIFAWATPLQELFEAAQGWCGNAVASVLSPGPFRSLLIDGVIAGVGGVLVFLPQIVILFFFIAVLEDCGYMARAAFLMDKLMTKVGLSGKSFVPLMSSFACAIPGVMATRVIENRRDRMTTILVAPLMSCSARQPVYVLMIAVFIPGTSYLGGWISLKALTLFAMTFLGAVIAVPIAWLLKKTLFKGETPPFVMELPSYKWPSPRLVFNRVYDRGKAFVTRAGSLIFATTILVWAAGYFPGDHTEADTLQAQIESLETELAEPLKQREELQKVEKELTESHEALLERLPNGNQTDPEYVELRARMRANQKALAAVERTLRPLTEKQELKNVRQAALLEGSLLGRVGHAIEPAVRPLGWDWRIGVGVIASFPAREVIIGTLGTIYSLGGTDDPKDRGLQDAVRSAEWPDGRPVFNVAVALSVMVFFALCAQCVSTLVVIHRETNSWLWPIFTFTYMTLLAYSGAFVVYQTATRWLA